MNIYTMIAARLGCTADDVLRVADPAAMREVTEALSRGIAADLSELARQVRDALGLPDRLAAFAAMLPDAERAVLAGLDLPEGGAVCHLRDLAEEVGHAVPGTRLQYVVHIGRFGAPVRVELRYGRHALASHPIDPGRGPKSGTVPLLLAIARAAQGIHEWVPCPDGGSPGLRLVGLDFESRVYLWEAADAVMALLPSGWGDELDVTGWPTPAIRGLAVQ